MGHIISAGGIKPGPAKVDAITKMPPPKDVSKVRTFLNMIAYVCKFIAGCGELIAPLTEILDSKRPFHWTPARDASFQALKTALISAPVLQFPNSEAQYKLETDAFDRAIGGVLCVNTGGGVFLPVAYESRKLSTTEQRYPGYNKELGAISHCVEKWSCYLEGARFPPRVLNDHKSLKFFGTQAHMSRQKAGWMERLSPYQLKIEYKPGRKLVTANALSRLYVESITGMKELDP